MPENENLETNYEKLELNYDEDSITRLQKEIDFDDDANAKAIGNFLLCEFKNDKTLKADYSLKKRTLRQILDFVRKQAQERSKALKNANCVMVEDKEVYGWAIHFIHDGNVNVKDENTSFTLSKETKANLEERAEEEYLAECKRKLEEQEAKRIEREKKAKEKAIAKEKEEQEASGQLNLFDFGDENL